MDNSTYYEPILNFYTQGTYPVIDIPAANSDDQLNLPERYQLGAPAGYVPTADDGDYYLYIEIQTGSAGTPKNLPVNPPLFTQAEIEAGKQLTVIVRTVDATGTVTGQKKGKGLVPGGYGPGK